MKKRSEYCATRQAACTAKSSNHWKTQFKKVPIIGTFGSHRSITPSAIFILVFILVPILVYSTKIKTRIGTKIGYKDVWRARALESDIKGE